MAHAACLSKPARSEGCGPSNVTPLTGHNQGGALMTGTASEDLAGVKAAFLAGPERIRTLLYRGVRIQSAFQPVYELATGAVVGHKALLRCDDADLDPDSLFTIADYYLETLDLSDKVRILHLCNYAALAPADDDLRLFVPTRAETLGHPVKARTLEACLTSLGLAAGRVVLALDVEVFEDVTPRTLETTLIPFRALGCAVLANGHDGRSMNPKTILAGNPDFVALELSSLSPGASMSTRALQRLTRRFRLEGLKTILGGIESEQDVETASSVGVEMGYGFHLGLPERNTLRVQRRPELARLRG